LYKEGAERIGGEGPKKTRRDYSGRVGGGTPVILIAGFFSGGRGKSPKGNGIFGGERANPKTRKAARIREILFSTRATPSSASFPYYTPGAPPRGGPLLYKTRPAFSPTALLLLECSHSVLIQSGDHP